MRSPKKIASKPRRSASSARSRTTPKASSPDFSHTAERSPILGWPNWRCIAPEGAVDGCPLGTIYLSLGAFRSPVALFHIVYRRHMAQCVVDPSHLVRRAVRHYREAGRIEDGIRALTLAECVDRAERLANAF